MLLNAAQIVQQREGPLHTWIHLYFNWLHPNRFRVATGVPPARLLHLTDAG
jgi:hypothetical protein